MLLVARHQISILFRQRYFIENDVLRVWEMLSRRYFFTTNTIHQYPVYCPFYQVLWDIELLAMQHIYVFVDNFLALSSRANLISSLISSIVSSGLSLAATSLRNA